ncbi:MAG: serine/threonine protein kinase [Planctomycetia bacterium]|nr:serine/threonine protein kinase [Planctomycetia bacterium]
MSKHTATLADGKKIDYLPDVIGEGGFKRVHFARDKKSVVCFFKDQQSASDTRQVQRLEGILGKFNPTTHPDTGKYFANLFCWPTGIIVSPMLGITAPAYPSQFFFATGKWKGKEKNGKWFVSPKLRKLLPPAERGDWKNYLDLCALMARGVRRMHLAGLAHSDLSCNNVLIDPPNGRCVIIDVDSLVVPGIYPAEVAGTPGYIAPEVLGTLHLPESDPAKRLPCNYTDMHALAVLVYENLLRRHPLKGPKVYHTDPAEDDRLAFGEKALFIEHPTDASNRVAGISVTLDHLGPYLKAECIKAFVTGLHDPTKRPTATAWESALNKTADLLFLCPNSACEERWCVHLEGKPPVCPWCGTKLKSRLPVLDLYYAPKPGQFRPENHRIVGYANRPIYPWHVRTDVRNAETVPAEPQAVVLPHGDKWILKNLKLESLISPKGNPVPEGQACLLQEGDEIVLSRHEKGRMVCVRMVP